MNDPVPELQAREKQALRARRAAKKGNRRSVNLVMAGSALVHESWALESSAGKFGMSVQSGTNPELAYASVCEERSSSGEGASQVRSLKCPRVGKGHRKCEDRKSGLCVDIPAEMCRCSLESAIANGCRCNWTTVSATPFVHGAKHSGRGSPVSTRPPPPWAGDYVRYMVTDACMGGPLFQQLPHCSVVIPSATSAKGAMYRPTHEKRHIQSARAM